MIKFWDAVSSKGRIELVLLNGKKPAETVLSQLRAFCFRLLMGFMEKIDFCRTKQALPVYAFAKNDFTPYTLLFYSGGKVFG